ncbi:hypothetical protein WME76_00555 [Sorangium sp. So ce119]
MSQSLDESAEQEGIPDNVSVEDDERGEESSLNNLARSIERASGA